jgi:hypothetical protein
VLLSRVLLGQLFEAGAHLGVFRLHLGMILRTGVIIEPYALSCQAPLEALALGFDGANLLLQRASLGLQSADFVLHAPSLLLPPRHPQDEIAIGHRNRAPAPALAHEPIAGHKGRTGRKSLSIVDLFDELDAGQIAANPVWHFGSHLNYTEA